MDPEIAVTTIESLPDPLLGKIFATAGRQEGESITLVSRRWHRVFFSEPALWRELVLVVKSLAVAHDQGQRAPWFAAKEHVLRRVGGFVQRLTSLGLGNSIPDGWRLSSNVLAHLSPGALQSLQLEFAEADAVAAEALRQFTGLTQLVADSCANSCLVAALPSLPQLQSLTLSGGTQLLGLAAALQQLTQLTDLCCLVSEPLPGLSTLFLLTQLRTLFWGEWRQSGVLRADVQQLSARLAQLEDWRISSFLRPDGQGSMQFGGAMLGSFTISGFCPSGRTVQQLTLWKVKQMSSLQQLVAAALPAGTQPSQLRSLSMDWCVLPLPAVWDCAFLGHLTSLALQKCTFPDGGPTAGIEALLQQAPRLQKLTLRQCLASQRLPPALVSLTGLRHLSLPFNRVAELPAGPYLSSLVSLDLRTNTFTRLPPELTAATGLTALCLAAQIHWALCDADLDSVLLRLPRLRRLFVDMDSTPQSVLARLAQAAPQIAVSKAPRDEDWQQG